MYKLEQFTVSTTQGDGTYLVDARGFAKASVLAVPNTSNISTGVIEIKEGWSETEPIGISFSPAKTLTLDGSSATEGIDVTNSPYLLLDVTTFEADKSVEVIVYLTDAVSPV